MGKQGFGLSDTFDRLTLTGDGSTPAVVYEVGGVPSRSRPSAADEAGLMRQSVAALGGTVGDGIPGHTRGPCRLSTAKFRTNAVPQATLSTGSGGPLPGREARPRLNGEFPEGGSYVLATQGGRWGGPLAAQDSTYKVGRHEGGRAVARR